MSLFWGAASAENMYTHFFDGCFCVGCLEFRCRFSGCCSVGYMYMYMYMYMYLLLVHVHVYIYIYIHVHVHMQWGRRAVFSNQSESMREDLHMMHAHATSKHDKQARGSRSGQRGHSRWREQSGHSKYHLPRLP